MTHDCKRHGTTTLFAALDVKSGLVTGDCMPRHRAKEFLTFLRRIDRAVKKPRNIHIVLDNHATHKTPERQARLPVTRQTILSHAEVQPTLGIKQNGKWDIAWLPGMAKPGDPVLVGDQLRARIGTMIAAGR